jgi:hypothetical protein
LQAVARSGGATIDPAEAIRPRPAPRADTEAVPAAAKAAPARDQLAAGETELDFATEAEAVSDTVAADTTPAVQERAERFAEAEPVSAPEPEAEPAGEAAAEEPTEDAGDKVRAILRGRGEGQGEAAPDAPERDARVRAAFLNRAPSRWQAWMVPGAAAAAVLLLFGILILARESIVRVLPGTATMYSALGFAGAGAVGAGLEFRDVTSRREWAGTDEVLIVRGVIANVSKDNVAVPPVRVALYDIDEYEVQSMTVPNAVNELGSGNTISFEARIPNPALKAQRIRVTFQAPGHRGAA